MMTDVERWEMKGKTMTDDIRWELNRMEKIMILRKHIDVLEDIKHQVIPRINQTPEQAVKDVEDMVERKWMAISDLCFD